MKILQCDLDREEKYHFVTKLYETHKVKVKFHLKIVKRKNQKKLNKLTFVLLALPLRSVHINEIDSDV